MIQGLLAVSPTGVPTLVRLIRGLPALDRVERIHQHEDVEREIVADRVENEELEGHGRSRACASLTARYAMTNPSIIATTSDIEFSTLSPK